VAPSNTYAEPESEPIMQPAAEHMLQLVD